MVSIDSSRTWNWPPHRGRSRSSTSFLSSEKNDFVSLRNYFFFLAKKSYLLIYLNFTITCLCLCVCLYCLLYAFKAFRPSHCSARTLQIFAFFFFFSFGILCSFIVSSLGWFFLVKVFPLMNNYFLILVFFLIISLRKVPLWAHTCLNRSWVKSYTKLVIPLC